MRVGDIIRIGRVPILVKESNINTKRLNKINDEIEDHLKSGKIQPFITNGSSQTQLENMNESMMKLNNS